MLTHTHIHQAARLLDDPSDFISFSWTLAHQPLSAETPLAFVRAARWSDQDWVPLFPVFSTLTDNTSHLKAGSFHSPSLAQPHLDPLQCKRLSGNFPGLSALGVPAPTRSKSMGSVLVSLKNGKAWLRQLGKWWMEINWQLRYVCYNIFLDIYILFHIFYKFRTSNEMLQCVSSCPTAKVLLFRAAYTHPFFWHAGNC